MFERFTKDARAAVERAEREARELGSDTVDAEHLLLALTGAGGAAERALHDAGLDRDGVLDALDVNWARTLAAVGITGVPAPRGSAGGGPRPGRVKFARPARTALERALRSTLERGDRRIETGHLLLGLLAIEAGTVPRALDAAGVDCIELRTRAGRELDQAGSE